MFVQWVKFTYHRDVFRVTKTTSSWGPSWSFEQHRQLVAQSFNIPHLLSYIHHMMQLHQRELNINSKACQQTHLNPEWIKRGQWVDQTIYHFIVFGRKSTKNPVPNNEHSGYKIKRSRKMNKVGVVSELVNVCQK